jgi:biopolymer transport protein ExbD
MTLLLVLTLFTTPSQPIDATQLTFTLVGKDSITVRVGRWKLTTTKTEELNRFVDIHLKEIDPAKIVVYGDKDAKYETFHPVLDVLKKHDWMKFRLEDTSAKPKPAAPKVVTTRT